MFRIPEIVRGWLPIDVPVHGAFEEDGGKDALAGETGGGDDARAHLMHEREHFFIIGPGSFLNSVILQRLGCAATALVEGGDEAGLGPDFLQLLLLQV